MPRYRAAVVGCGGIGRNHAHGYDDHEEIELVGLADVDTSVLDRAHEEFSNADRFTDFASMLEASSPDFVSICTSHRSHATLTVDAAEFGVEGIICEKPMATSLGEATAMRTAADRTDTKLVIGHQTRFATAHERARELIAAGRIGTPEAASVRTAGGLINNGTHFVDLTRYVLHDPAPAWCAGHIERQTDRYERGVPAEDACVGRVCFEDGSRLTIETDTPDDLVTDADLVIRGTDGILAIDYRRSLRIVTPDGVETIEPETARSLRLRLLDEFIMWVDGTIDDHRCSASQSYATMEILMGLYDAVRRQEIIAFPVKTMANPLQELIESGELTPAHPGQYDIRHPYASVRHD